MAILLSLIYLYPILVINSKDSLWAAREHSYQLLNCTGYSTGGKQAGRPSKKAHTQIIKIYFIVLLTAIILWDISYRYMKPTERGITHDRH